MNYVAEVMVHVDSESLGWLHYAQVLEQEHLYDAEYVQQVIDGIKSWIVPSSAQDEVRFGTRCIVDGILYGNLCKVLSQAGKACCGLIADIPELRFLREFTDVYAEYGLATELGEVGLASMEDVGISLMKSEVSNIKKSKLLKLEKETAEAISKKNSKEFTNEEKLIKATYNKEFWSRKGAKGVASNANGREGLVEKIKSLLSGQKNAVKIRNLPDGRIRYYKAENLSKTPGQTRGSSYVTEYDPKRGIVRSWQECYDHLGNVNRIHPKSLNGADVVGQHYPPIAKEIEFWKNLED